MNYQTGRDFAKRMDRNDPLRSFRERFHLPRKKDGSGAIYFLGNSLGLQPKNAADYVSQILTDWQVHGVEGHFHGEEPWLTYAGRVNRLLEPVLGALPGEVTVMNGLSVNLHLMMVSFYRPTASRHRILIEERAFPSDRYAVTSQIRYHGYDPAEALVECRARAGEDSIRTEEIEELLQREGEEIALVMLGGVNYYTGQAFDIDRITRAAHAKGCAVGWDLAHAAGNLPLRMHDWDVDFAVWCSYKYLNAGPGGVGGCFVHDRQAARPDIFRFAGWWGNDPASRFQMRPDFQAAPGADGWQISNTPMLALAAQRASMEVFGEAGMERLREKSVALTGYLEFLLGQTRSAPYSIITPKGEKERGAQLSLRMHVRGKEVCTRLNEEGVICDWREPDVIRMAPVPLYNTFTEVFDAAEALARIST